MNEPAIVHPAGTKFVLIKGYYDSGVIDGVYGPYTKEHAEWLLSGMLECSASNWTLAEMQTGPSE